MTKALLLRVSRVLGWIVIAVVTLALLVTGVFMLGMAQDAHADLIFGDGFEYGDAVAPLVSSDGLYSAEGSTTPAVSALGVRDQFCNHSSVDDRGTSCTSNSDCDVANTSCSTDADCQGDTTCDTGTSSCIGECWQHYNNDYSLRVAASSATRETLFKFMMSGAATGTGVGCYAEIYAAFGVWNIDVFYEDDELECASGTNDGTECTADTDCDGDFEGEAACLPSVYGSTKFLPLNQHMEITLCQNNSGADVLCQIYQGGYERGQQTRPQGFCAGGADAGDACLIDGNCTGSTCTTTNVSNITSVRIGGVTNYLEIGSQYMTADNDFCVHALVYMTDVSPWTYFLDDVLVDSDQTEADFYKAIAGEDLIVDGNHLSENWSAESGCSAGSHYLCLDERPDPDDGTTRVSSSTVPSAEIDDYEISTPTSAAALGYDGDAVGISTVAVAKDRGTGGSQTSQDLTVTMYKGVVGASSAQTVSTFDITNYTPVVMSAAGGAYFDTDAEIATSDVAIQADGSACSTNCKLDLTTLYPTAWRRMTVPAIPGIATDAGTDGLTRLCIVGDSTINDLDPNLVGRFEDYDGITACTQGSTMMLDVEAQLTAILDGGSGGRLKCSSMRGGLGPCDDVVIMAGGNSAQVLTMSPYDTDFATGQCRGGTKHGEQCSCTSHSAAQSGTGDTFYCLNNTNDSGANWLATETAATDTTTCRACSTSADCGTNIPCTSDSDCTPHECISLQCHIDCGTEDAGECDDTSLYNPYTVEPRRWVDAGCIDRENCPNGLCIGVVTEAATIGSVQRMIDIATARTGADAVRLIWATQPRPTACSSSTLFTGHQNRFERIQQGALDLFEANNFGWIDVDDWFQINCLDKDRRSCMRDTVHWSRNVGDTNGGLNLCDGGTADDDGTDKVLDALEAYLEKLSGNSDGACSTVCTAGKIGNVCSADADCDLYRWPN